MKTNNHNNCPMKSLRSFGLLVLAVGSLTSSLEASSIVTVPAGLAAGSQYRLMFVTTGTYTATSTDIATYNAEVAAEAAAIPGLAALGATWLDFGATATTSVLQNVGASGPSVGLYLLDGSLIARGTGTTGSGIFAGLPDININEAGIAVTVAVWTGFNGDGTTPGNSLGHSPYVAIGNTYVGVATGTAALWTMASQGPNNLQLHLYGISSVLTVAPAPEPGTWISLGIGLCGLGWLKRRRRSIP